MTLREAAAALGVFWRTVMKWVDAGLLAATRAPCAPAERVVRQFTGRWITRPDEPESGDYEYAPLAVWDWRDEYLIAPEELARFRAELMPGGVWDRRLLPDDAPLRRALAGFIAMTGIDPHWACPRTEDGP